MSSGVKIALVQRGGPKKPKNVIRGKTALVQNYSGEHTAQHTAHSTQPPGEHTAHSTQHTAPGVVLDIREGQL